MPRHDHSLPVVSMDHASTASVTVSTTTVMTVIAVPITPPLPPPPVNDLARAYAVSLSALDEAERRLSEPAS